MGRTSKAATKKSKKAAKSPASKASKAAGATVGAKTGDRKQHASTGGNRVVLDGEDRTPLTLEAVGGSSSVGTVSLDEVFSGWGESVATPSSASTIAALENMGILTPLVSTLVDRSLLSKQDDVHSLVPTPAASTVEETAAALGGVVLMDEEGDGEMDDSGAAESKSAVPTMSVSVGVGVDMDEMDEEELAEEAKRQAFLRERLDLSDAELALPVQIMLQETDTITLFHSPGLCVSFDNTHEHDKITARNAVYEARCHDTQAADAADMFGSHEVQTFNAETVAVYVQAALPDSAEMGTTAEPWMLYDAQQRALEETGALASGGGASAAEPITTAGSATDVGAIVARANRSADLALGQVSENEAAEATMSSDHLLQSLLLAERVLSQNLFHPKHLQYRGVPLHLQPERIVESPLASVEQTSFQAKRLDAVAAVKTAKVEVTRVQAEHAGQVEKKLAKLEEARLERIADGEEEQDAPVYEDDEEEEDDKARRLELEGVVVALDAATAELAFMNAPVVEGADAVASKPLEILWRYHCAETHGRRVTCLAWNERDKDMLAVAYGSSAAEREAQSSSAKRALPNTHGAATPATTGGLTAGATSSAEPDQSGLICLWSLQNPEFPLRVIYTGPRDEVAEEEAEAEAAGRAAKKGGGGGDADALDSWDGEGAAESGVAPTGRIEGTVLSLAFSKLNPQLLAGGMSTGMVALWDLSDVVTTEGNEDTPQLASHHAQAHKSGVSQIVWTKQEQRGGRTVSESSEAEGAAAATATSPSRANGERLLSISTDGSVKQWNLRKGLFCAELMKLKRTKGSSGQPSGWRPTAGDSSGEGGFLSRHGSGLCLAVPPSDSSVYFAGTEDGTIHMCSTAYNEEFLATFAGHTAPVYALRCNPRMDGLFASCSADATICLWSHKTTSTNSVSAAADIAPLHTLLAPHLEDRKIVNDVEWSSENPSILGSATYVCAYTQPVAAAPRPHVISPSLPSSLLSLRFLCSGDGRFEVWNLVNSTLEPEISLCGPVPMAVVTSDDNLVEGNAARHQTTLSGSSEDRALSFAAHFESLGAVGLEFFFSATSSFPPCLISLSFHVCFLPLLPPVLLFAGRTPSLCRGASA